MKPTRFQLDGLLSRMREFSDCVSEYELNAEGLERADVQGMNGFVEVRYAFHRPTVERLRDSLPEVRVIDPDVTELKPTKETAI